MEVINLGILAHVDAGKTSVTENILHKSGIINSIGRVDTGNTITDSDLIERQRGITIKASTVSFYWGGKKFNIIDTPGHVDFIAEVERSLKILDAAILVISAKEGIQPQTKILFKILRKNKIPTLIFINKLDRTGVNLEVVYENMMKLLGPFFIPIQHVSHSGSKEFTLENWGNNSCLKMKILNKLADNDDEILFKVINQQDIENSKIKDSIYNQFSKGLIYPVLHGSAILSKGIQELLDEAINYIPHTPNFQKEDLSGVVYKIEKNNLQKKIYIRLFEGSLKIRDKLLIKNKGIFIKINNLEYLEGDKTKRTDTVNSGDIAVLTNIKELQIGDIIGNYSKHIKDFSIVEPTLKSNITPINPKDRFKLLEALADLAEEDPYLKIKINKKNHSLLMHLFGVVQMEVIQKTLEERYNILTFFSEPTTNFKATIKTECEAIVKAGNIDNPYCASMEILVEPISTGSGFEFQSRVSNGYLKKSFQEGIKQGLIKGLKEIFEFELTDVRVTLTWALFDSANSTPSDFRNLAPIVLRKAIESTQTILLEPILSFEITSPSEFTGKILQDLVRMGGEISSSLNQNGHIYIRGLIPADTSKVYSSRLSNYTNGEGLFVTDFNCYRVYNNSKMTYPILKID